MSQTETILRDLERGKTVTPLNALNRHGIMRLGARIYDLKRDGYAIETIMITRGKKRFAGYRLAA